MENKPKKKKNLSSLKKELVNNKESKNLPVKIEIQYNDNHTKAYIIINKLIENYSISEKLIDNLLTKENIVYGVRRDSINKLLEEFRNSNKGFEKKYLIAIGDEVVNSTDETISLLSQHKDNVIEGETIGEKLQMKKGKFGITVHNKKISPKLIRDNNINIGKNIETLELDNKTIYTSKIDGVLMLDENNIVNIIPEEPGNFEITINNKTGEILLTVNPPIGKKEPVNLEMVNKYLQSEKLKSIAITSNIEEALNIGKTDRVENYIIGREVPKDYQINVNIAKIKCLHLLILIDQ